MRRLALALVATTSLVAGCAEAPPAAVAVPDVFDLAADPAADIPEPSLPRQPLLTGEQLRSTLEVALTWHGIAVAQVMRHARAGDPDLDVWIDQLVANTDAITAAVGALYGPVPARAFHQQWAQHTQFLTDHAVAVGAGDDEAAAEALRLLGFYAADAASFFQVATAGTLPADAVEALLVAHVDHLVTLVHADQRGDVAGAAEAARTDGAHLVAIAGGLTTGIAAALPDVVTGPTDTPLAEVCTIATVDAGAAAVTELIEGDADHDAATAAADALDAITGAVAAATAVHGG